MADGRVLIAPGASPLAASPTWVRYDNLSSCRCYGFDSYAGRQSELDTTDTGTATVYFHDQNGTLDDDALVGAQILLQLRNAVTGSWHERWRGHIDDVERDLVDVPGLPLANVSIQCVGIFDYLGGVKMLPGVMGDALPAGMSGVVFYEDEAVDDRIIAALTDAGIPSGMRVVFSGNVDVNETLYDPDDVILTVCRDAADAEFPGVANFYEDRRGKCVFHGRFARFDPEGTAASASDWDFQRWQAATRGDVGTTRAQIREFSYNRPRARIINSYLAYPREDENGVAFDRSLIDSMIRTDATSIADYGYRGGEAPDLIIKEHKTNGNTGAQECELFSEFYIENYAVPRRSVQRVAIRSIPPSDDRAAATWDAMCRMDISDAMHLWIGEAGMADEEYFIDGVEVECRVLNPAMDLVTVTPNLTPASYYGTDVFSA